MTLLHHDTAISTDEYTKTYSLSAGYSYYFDLAWNDDPNYNYIKISSGTGTVLFNELVPSIFENRRRAQITATTAIVVECHTSGGLSTTRHEYYVYKIG